MTHLSTLKVKVREVVKDCALYSTEELGDPLKYVAENGQETFFLQDRLIEKIAEMMQKHEEWVAGGRKGINPNEVPEAQLQGRESQTEETPEETR
jgi:hypothetical protein